MQALKVDSCTKRKLRIIVLEATRWKPHSVSLIQFVIGHLMEIIVCFLLAPAYVLCLWSFLWSPICVVVLSIEFLGLSWFIFTLSIHAPVKINMNKNLRQEKSVLQIWQVNNDTLAYYINWLVTSAYILTANSSFGSSFWSYINCMIKSRYHVQFSTFTGTLWIYNPHFLNSMDQI
jgi:hypothetical protein